ncbi:MAG TPA: type 4a pilus biogenesis protein PilO [Balneolaceae bacterium]|nr:type 4a pilus biogenesis protein PilO [Balneolaceae bacterium]
MSYAIRNSLILLIVLLLFVGGGWGYIYYFQQEKIDKLQKELTTKKHTLKQKQQIADQYQPISKSYKKASKYYKNFQKALYVSSSQNKVFGFLTRLNHADARNNFNFKFKDSTTHKKYGVMQMKIEGKGPYRNVVNFIRGIELSKPLNKIKNVSLYPVKGVQDFDSVSYSFTLKSYYDRSKILAKPSFDISYNIRAALHNPFYPLVHNIRPNTDHKVNIKKSKLVALSTNKVFLIDQNGVMRVIKIGGRVYLGKLTNINLSNRTATFTLIEGGIKKTVKLKENPKK